MPACHVRPHVYAPRAAAHAALAIGALLGLCAHAAASTPAENRAGVTVRGLVNAGRYAEAESLAWTDLDAARSAPADSIRVAAALEGVAHAMAAGDWR